ncbi:sugar nucleotide-binding protein, partial [Eudoraea sp.]|uniref:sugar nucleotide-binding protein n=1 Tax=Eudoraea sp. TaxID=1979955 RepID=UPI003C70E98A
MKNILVTGSEGQLGKCVQKIANNYDSFNFKFMDSKGLDITNPKSIDSAFKSGHYNYCINCAAYTDVEQAEKTPERAFT